MAAELALIDILRDDATIGALVGGTGTSARVYPIERPQTSLFPSITVIPDDIDPSDTKTGVSKLDEEFITVYYYSDTYSSNNSLSVAGRSALDRNGGTYNGVVVQSIRFEDRDSWVEEIENRVIYVTEHNYKVRVQR